MQRQPLAAQGAERLQALRAHLERIVREALAVTIDDGTTHIDAAGRCDSVPPERIAPLDQACGTACALCKGDCCLEGAARMAYLSPETIRRVVAVRPAVKADALIDEYLALTPARVTDGGCFFQGSQGCTLPRDLRSDVCNRYFCNALRNFRAAAASSGTSDQTDSVRAFFVVILPSGRRQARFHESPIP